MSSTLDGVSHLLVLGVRVEHRRFICSVLVLHCGSARRCVRSSVPVGQMVASSLAMERQEVGMVIPASAGRSVDSGSVKEHALMNEYGLGCFDRRAAQSFGYVS